MSNQAATPRSASLSAASLLPDWPQAPSPTYALAPIRTSSARASSVRSASSSPRSLTHERSAPYPSSRPARTEMLDVQHPHHPQQAARMHDSELYRTRQALQSHLGVRQSSSSRSAPAQQPRSAEYAQTSSTSSNSPSSNKEAQHKVYLLNCKHCGNFLSDRGMKAVLLLKPNITLYSTDIVPSTCGPFTAASAFHGGADPNEPPVERTCECLTQSLGCYGCGAQVGYNIISPCTRCTSSVMKHSRSSNGHRTVLHCSEIAVRERRYIPGEPGVRAQPPRVIQTVAAHSPMQMYAESRYDAAAADLFRHSNASRRDVYRMNVPSFDDDDLEAEKAEANAALVHQQYYQQREYRQAGHHGRAHQHPGSAGSQRSSAPSGSGRVLRRGDTLFWSDLVAGGERAQPFDPDPILERPTVGR
ncbi:protein FAM72A [Moesziomyces antarcticus]|nr:protein FAM72A [Moesziomyces antarcticus]GAK63019.1 protein FAM72A [Moesziomyces antarcticus]